MQSRRDRLDLKRRGGKQGGKRIGKRMWVAAAALAIVIGCFVAFRGPLGVEYNHLRARLFTNSSHSKREARKSLPDPSFYAGVVEGFYGQPWSDQARNNLFVFMNAHHMNSYVYAPKDDPYQRKDWRTPYPKARFAAMQSLIQKAADRDIDFIYSISPGLSIVYSSKADRTALLGKIDQLTTAGVHTIMLSLDDVPMKLDTVDAAVYGGNLALAQSSLMDWLVSQEKARNSRVRFIFTPTVYNGLDGGNYWLTLQQQLDPNVDVVWTGPYVLSSSITVAQLNQVKKELGHPIVIWDNYPVNDYTYTIEKRPRLLLGPLLGRESGILPELAGYLSNPMIQPYASEIPLATVGDWLADPVHYNPVSAWNTAINQLGGEDPAALKFVSASTLEPKFFPASAYGSLASDDVTDQLRNNVTAFYTTWRSGGDLSQTPLNQQFTAMVHAASALRSGLTDGALGTDLQPWLTSLQLQGQAGLDAIAWLAAERSNRGSSDASSLQNALAADVRRLENSDSVSGMTPSIAGDIAAQFAAKVKASGIPPASLNVTPVGGM